MCSFQSVIHQGSAEGFQESFYDPTLILCLEDFSFCRTDCQGCCAHRLACAGLGVGGRGGEGTIVILRLCGAGSMLLKSLQTGTWEPSGRETEEGVVASTSAGQSSACSENFPNPSYAAL